ncbi:DeoR/GlpR family DNA-binding transcription regulator [Paenibacillus alginolyticus]|uniref:DeoR/GlpR family DNA-binding transcription regulator n=1 Tax=Paenibacillus alginolyticus TaxID=59839 RepID=UPI0003F7A4AA|nr:DeoR/GlpR family DNA-binding transcription regulator [Paenibacillus alginolyticus]MCY9665711.1 DeoR/GlpR family DNA-binding transcription regulator [Paenibacillus alginolyticus]
MIPYMRRKRIVEEVGKKEIVYVEELANSLKDISLSTIRRDLRSLAEEGQIELLRGGAVRVKEDAYETPIQTKQFMHLEKKDKIAKFAASLVNDGDVIYIDSGTTVFEMVKYLKNKNVKMVTSNTKVINELEDTKYTCMILGGEITKSIASIAGPMTETLLANMFFDKAFLGASGFDTHSGINTPDPKEAKKKEIVKKNSKETYVLVDSSKANKTTFCKVFDIDECIIITDEANEVLEAKENAKYFVVS